MEQKGLHCHMVLEFRNPLSITFLEKFKFLAGKSSNIQDLMFVSRNVEVSKSSSGSYRYLTHTTDSNDGTKDKVAVHCL